MLSYINYIRLDLGSISCLHSGSGATSGITALLIARIFLAN